MNFEDTRNYRVFFIVLFIKDYHFDKLLFAEGELNVVYPTPIVTLKCPYCGPLAHFWSRIATPTF